MSKISFNKPGGTPSLAATETPTAEVVANVPADAKTITATDAPTSTAVVVAPPAPVGTPNGGFHDEDNIDPRDLSLPRLNIVQKVGELSNVFPPGSLVLDGQLVLQDAPAGGIGKEGNPIHVVVLGFQSTKFIEKVEGGGMGRMFGTEAEMVASGGTADFNEAKRLNKAWYQRSTTALALVEQPKGDKSIGYFGLELDGRKWALVFWTLKGTGFTNGARPIMTKRQIGELKATGYRGGVFKVATKLQKFGANVAYIPVPKLAEMTSDKFRSDLKSLGL